MLTLGWPNGNVNFGIIGFNMGKSENYGFFLKTIAADFHDTWYVRYVAFRTPAHSSLIK